MAWDEVHNDMNNREWMKDNTKFIIKWATQLRKLGFVAYFLSQHRDNTDAALRRIANAEVRLRNQRESVRVLGIRWCPVPFFLAIWVPANTPKLSRADSILGIERYFLGWERKMYDTLDVFHGLDGDLGEINKRVILLPKPGTWDRKMIDNVALELVEAGVSDNENEALVLAAESIGKSPINEPSDNRLLMVDVPAITRMGDAAPSDPSDMIRAVERPPDAAAS